MNLHDVPDFTPKATRVLERDEFGRFVARWMYSPVALDVVEGAFRPTRRLDDPLDRAGEWADFDRRFAEAARRAALGG